MASGVRGGGDQERYAQTKGLQGRRGGSKVHKHKCPDCGKIFDCPIPKSCKLKENEYPCVDCIDNHMVGFWCGEEPK